MRARACVRVAVRVRVRRFVFVRSTRAPLAGAWRHAQIHMNVDSGWNVLAVVQGETQLVRSG